jgi:hypothetical protein
MKRFRDQLESEGLATKKVRQLALTPGDQS